MPVSKKAHQAQLPETPCPRTRSVTRFGVSVENVVATIEMPNSHHGMDLPAAKNSVELLLALRVTAMPIASDTAINPAMMPQSIHCNSMALSFPWRAGFPCYHGPSARRKPAIAMPGHCRGAGALRPLFYRYFTPSRWHMM